MKQTAIEYVRERCYIEPETGCWHWRRHTTEKGVPMARWAGRVRYVPRFLWEALHGTVQRGRYVYHTCDHVDCCNPEHLAVGTRKAQMAAAKKRGTIRRGNVHPMFGKPSPQTKTTMAQAREIRQRVANGESPHNFHHEYGICVAQAYKIARNLARREGVANNSVFNLSA